jgi:membrane associated rhomboid family serine protease
MGDRPNWYKQGQGYGGGGGGGYGSPMRGIALPKPTPAVKFIMIACGAMFVLQLITVASGNRLSLMLGATADGWWQLWRYITFQFLHSPQNLWHIVLNMLGLYFLGTALERAWGTKQFVKFYLTCGITAGAAYVVISLLLLPPGQWSMPLIGASGGVYGVLLAAAVLFPHFRLIFFLFPVPIRLAAIIIFGIMIFTVLGGLASGSAGPSFWSDVAHLGGAVAAAVWIWVLPKWRLAIAQAEQAAKDGAWEKRLRDKQKQRDEVDRILDKVKQQGLGSLSAAEKRALQKASQEQRREDQKYR